MKTYKWIARGSFNIQAACIVTMNRLEKLRRSAMSIAANAHWPFPKLRRSGMFVRRFMGSLLLLRTCTGTMNGRASCRRLLTRLPVTNYQSRVTNHLLPTIQISTQLHPGPAKSTKRLSRSNCSVTTLKLLTPELHLTSPIYTYVHLTSPNTLIRIPPSLTSDL
jgi:hypothetical protein